MNVYDFDGTIYRGDSSIDFYLFCLYSDPALIKCLPKQLWGIVLYVLKIIDKTKLKEKFFCFIKYIDIENFVYDFWNSNENKIMKWYLDQKKEDDLIISASPDFLLKNICERLSIKNLIATVFDTDNCKIIGENCRGQEKLRRYKEQYGNVNIENFYSDSESDLPLAKISKHSYKVKGVKASNWIM